MAKKSATIKIPTIEERVSMIIDLSYKIFQARVVNESIIGLDNEASMQLQLGVILKNVGLLFEWANDEHFYIYFEKKLKLDINTTKTPKGNARCDIYIEFKQGEKRHKVGIELKYLPKINGEATTDSRLSILSDVENLERYRTNKHIDKGYAIVYSTNSNYADSYTRSNINIGDGVSVTGGKSNYKEIKLTDKYTFHWDSHDPHYFLKVEVGDKIEENDQ